MNSESNLIGFSDAGAHLRNMAFYNYPLRMLKFVKSLGFEAEPSAEDTQLVDVSLDL